MAIPNKVYEAVAASMNVNHGARLERGNKVYSLQRGSGRQVKATLFVKPGLDNLPGYEKKGYEVSTHSETGLAWKDIPLNQVPVSKDGDWEVWDEY